MKKSFEDRPPPYIQSQRWWTPGQIAEVKRLSYKPGDEIKYGPRRRIWDAPIVKRVKPFRGPDGQDL